MEVTYPSEEEKGEREGDKLEVKGSTAATEDGSPGEETGGLPEVKFNNV